MHVHFYNPSLNECVFSTAFIQHHAHIETTSPAASINGIPTFKTRTQVEHSVLFTGSSGVGKTAVVLDTLARLADDQYGEAPEEEAKVDTLSTAGSTGAWLFVRLMIYCVCQVLPLCVVLVFFRFYLLLCPSSFLPSFLLLSF